MNNKYNVLSQGNGYYEIEYKSHQKLLIFLNSNTFPQIDFSKLNKADYDNFDLDIEIVDDLKLHQESEGNEGSRTKNFNIKDLGSFNLVTH